MGCSKSKGSSSSSSLKKPEGPCGPEEQKVREHENTEYVDGGEGCYYVLQQAFALVRHGDRLDHTPEWDGYKGRIDYPNDTPLTAEGHEHATQVGEKLKMSGKPYGLIISSPYLRCVQTASRIAEVLKLPIHLDLDLGEVYDNMSMHGNVRGKPQHRQKEVLEAELKSDFPNITYIRDDDGAIKIDGKQQKFPERFEDARMRYCYKVMKLVQQGAGELMSIIMVTHADALAAVVGMLHEDWQIVGVPYTAYAVCTRKVKVLELGSETILKEEPVYEHPGDWDVQLSKGFEHKPIPKDRLQEVHKEHERDMKEMDSQAGKIKTTYILSDEQVQQHMEALALLGAHDTDSQRLLKKAANSHHHAQDERSSRILCAPHSKGKDTE